MRLYTNKNDQEDMKLAVQNLLSEVNYLESKPITEHVIYYCSIAVFVC